ncbi:MAG: GspH/FimT family pseudopilin [Pseudomonadota bacterium]
MLKPSIHKRSANGFTLIELMITIAALGILAVFAIPSFSFLLEGELINTDANNFVADLNLARSEAIKQNQTIEVNAKSGSWANGYLIKVSGSAVGVDLRDISPTARSVAPVETNTPAITSIQYTGIGTLGGANTPQFRFCKTSGEPGVTISISRTGRVTSDEISSCP